LRDRTERHLDARGVKTRHRSARADFLTAGDARISIGYRDSETLLTHHVNRHAFFAERIVDVARRIAADPGDPLGFQYPCNAIRGFDVHDHLPGRLR